MAVETLAVTLLMKANQYKTEARQAATATGQISSSAKTAGTATGKLDQQMSGLAMTAKFAVAGAATAAVVGFAKDSAQAFLGFDDAMNQSLAIMGDVGEDMRSEMSETAREIGRTSRIGAEEAAEAYFFLASAGLDAEQSIAALPQVAAFAQAGMFDMATATDLATDAQSALGLSSDDAAQNLENLTRVTDVFVRANTLANTSVQQVSEAMTNKAGAAMRAVGIDIEEGTAVLAAFADQGVKGAEAGTQFAIVLRDLQTKALENKDAFEKAGVAVFDHNGEFRNFADVIGDLEGRLNGMSDAQKKAELATLGFSDKSIAALTTLLGTSDAIREYESELRNAAGTTKQIADNQLESFQGQMDLLKGRIEDVQITLGEGLIPVLLEVGETILPLLEFLGLFAQGYSDVKNALGDFGDVILGSPLGFLLNQIQGNTEAADVAADAFATVSDETENLIGVTETSIGAAHRHRGSMEESAQAAEDLADEYGGVELTLLSAAEAAEVYDTAFRRLTDPVFRHIDDQQRLAASLETYQDVMADSKASTEEQEAALWDLLEAQANVDSSAAALPEHMGRSTQAFLLLADQLGFTTEETDMLREALEKIDGKTYRADIEAFFKSGGDPLARDAVRAGTGYQVGTAIFRAEGGPVAAGAPYIVGEKGPELFIPSHSGQIIPNQTTGGMMSGGGTTVYIGTVYGYDDFEAKVREAGVNLKRRGG